MAVKKTTARKAPPGDVQSVHRALDVLEAVGAARETGVSDLAGQLGLHVSTVHNLLRTLARRNYLLTSDGRYRLGPGATMLASQWDPLLSLPTLLQTELQTVSRSVGHAASATVLLGRDARMVGFDPAPGVVTVTAELWQRRNPLALATGRVLVALTRQGEWPEFIKAGHEAEPEWSEDRWHRELEEIAQTGACTKYATTPEGYMAVALPVRGRAGAVLCSIGSSVPAFLATDELAGQIRSALETAAANLSARLGDHAN